ncbi:MAG: hypothetical protein QM626_04570 [Microbacterium sp.]|uniref:hypothetical protein n=1 Tax=Microbacterium sp. TaxID=51671 RepID=UPI0039E6F18D
MELYEGPDGWVPAGSGLRLSPSTAGELRGRGCTMVRVRWRWREIKEISLTQYLQRYAAPMAEPVVEPARRSRRRQD